MPWGLKMCWKVDDFGGSPSRFSKKSVSAAFWRKSGNRFPWKGLRFQLMHVVFRAWTTDFCTSFFFLWNAHEF